MTNECLKRTTDENVMYGLLRDALKSAAKLEGKIAPNSVIFTVVNPRNSSEVRYIKSMI